MSNIQTNVTNDVTKAETAVKGAVSSVESKLSGVEADVKAVEAKTYSFSNVALVAAIALGVGIVVGLLL